MPTAMQRKMAMVRAGKKHGHKKTKRRVSGVGAIGKTKRRAKSRVVVVAKTRRRKSGGIGATGRGGTVKQVAVMAAGIGAGAAITHMLLRPIEHKLAARYPHVTKYLGAGEVIVGAGVFMKMNNPFIKMMGLGIMAGGVHTIMKQTNIGLHSPAEGTMGALMESTRQEIPYRVGNIIDDRRPYVNTATVAGIGSIVRRGDNRPTSTPTVGDYNDYGGVGDWNDDVDPGYLMPKGQF